MIIYYLQLHSSPVLECHLMPLNAVVLTKTRITYIVIILFLFLVGSPDMYLEVALCTCPYAVSDSDGHD